LYDSTGSDSPENSRILTGWFSHQKIVDTSTKLAHFRKDVSGRTFQEGLFLLRAKRTKYIYLPTFH
jgi:hypothetical protein